MENKECFKFAEWCSNLFIYTSTGWISKLKMTLPELNNESNYKTTEQLFELYSYRKVD